MVRLDDLRKMEAMGMGVAVCLEGGQTRRRSFVRYRDPTSGRLWAVDVRAGEYAEVWEDELDPVWQRLEGATPGEPRSPLLETPPSLSAAPARPAMLLLGR